MALATLKTKTHNKDIYKYSDQSAANTALTLNVPGAPPCTVKSVFIVYDATPTQTGVLIDLNSGLGADYDVSMFIGDANETITIWAVEAAQSGNKQTEVILTPDDVLDIVAPAAGGSIKSTITVIVELL